MSQRDNSPDGPPIPTREARQLQGKIVQADSGHRREVVNSYPNPDGTEQKPYEIHIPKGAYGRIDGANRLTDDRGQVRPDKDGATLKVMWNHKSFRDGPVEAEYRNQTDFARFCTVQTKDRTEELETANIGSFDRWQEKRNQHLKGLENPITKHFSNKEKSAARSRWWKDDGEQNKQPQQRKSKVQGKEQDYER